MLKLEFTQAAAEVINDRFIGAASDSGSTSHRLLVDEIVVEGNASVLRLTKMLCGRVERHGYSALVGPRHRSLRLVGNQLLIFLLSCIL